MRKKHKNTTHGMYNTPTYRSWRGMKNRCLSKISKDYPQYGGKGIKVCKRWHSFENFFKDMGVRPSGTSLDRKNNSGNYTPDNCRWATNKEQGRNKSNNTIIEINGERKTLAEWASVTGIRRVTIGARLRRGDTGERLLREVKYA